MQNSDLERMPIDELWALHEQITKILSSRITAEKQQLEKRLNQLNRGKITKGAKPSEEKANRPRRRYPKVFPKYQNPAVPSETWSGRGKRPRWLVSALQSGRTIKDFELRDSQAR
jgi:DNA-binding protein H-NS